MTVWSYKSNGEEDPFLAESLQVLQYDADTATFTDIGELITEFETNDLHTTAPFRRFRTARPSGRAVPRPGATVGGSGGRRPACRCRSTTCRPFATRCVDPGEHGIAVVTLDRPETRNAQNKRMTYEMNAAFDDASRRADVKVIVLQADGPHFSSGHDLRDDRDRFE